MDGRTRLTRHDEVPVTRHAKVQGKRSLLNPDDRGYWELRRKRRLRETLRSPKRSALLRRQNCKCALCGVWFDPDEDIPLIDDDVDGLEVGYPNLGKFKRAAHEFAVTIASNAGSLINYGERFRSGERIYSCLAESTVNAVVSRRFAKRHHMQWIKRGAHLLLQTRTRTLDGTLRPMFERWYPGLANDNGNEVAQAATA